MNPPLLRRARAPLGAALLALTAGCAVGPNYHRPAAPTPERFKEAEGWKPAEPREAASGSHWWSVYGDATLDELEKQIDVSNQTLRPRRPTGARRSRSSARRAPDSCRRWVCRRAPPAPVGPAAGPQPAAAGTTGTTASHPLNQFELAGNASWEFDIWGKIRRQLEGAKASAQASEADLAAARLSAQATLASDYIELRIADEQRHLLEETVDAFKRSLQITENQYHVGVVAKADVITAQTQLGGAQSQLIAVGVTRATLEHAIAVLIGKAPADFALAPATLGAAVPVLPAGMPSALLERRPDVAAAERQMAAANAQIGVAIAAYFPDLTLSGTYGFASDVVSDLVRRAQQLLVAGCGRERHAHRLRRAQGAGARRRAPPTTRPSPTTARPCSPPSSRSRTTSPRCASSSSSTTCRTRRSSRRTWRYSSPSISTAPARSPTPRW